MREPVGSPSRQKRWQVSPAAAVFLCALLARLWVLYRAADTTELLPDQGDMKFYSDWARRIVGGEWTDHQAFYGLPGYAYWLALVYRLVGFQPYAVSVFQVVLEACTATLLFKIAPLAFVRADRAADPAEQRRGRWIGALAAAGWVLSEPAQVYSMVLMPTCYLICAFWFVVWWTVRRWRAGRPALGEFFGLGVLMGIIAMGVANILFLVPLVLAAICLRRDWGAGGRAGARRFTLRLRLAAAALLVGGVGLGASPCALHNYLAAGEPVFLSAHSGINFYLGNNPQANGYPEIPAPLHADQEGMLKDSILWAEQAAGHPLKRVEVSRFWSGLAKDYIHQHPWQWLHLLGVKLGNFWNAFQYDDLGILSTFREDGVLLPGIGFGFAAALGLPGMLLAVWRRPQARWVAAAVLLHMGSLMTVFVTERYRLAAMPGLLLLGSFGLVETGRLLLSAPAPAGSLPWARWAPVAAYGLVLALAVVIIHRPVDPNVLFIDDYNSALADLERNHLDRAQAKLERVVQGHPDAESVFALGNVWLARGDHDRAKSFYRRSVQLDPRNHRALNNLGVLAAEEKRWTVAELFLIGSLAVEPKDAKTNFLLAQVRRELGDLPGARAAVAEALRLRPDHPEIRKLSDELNAPAPPAPAPETPPTPDTTAAAIYPPAVAALP